MYDQSKLSELFTFAWDGPGSTVIDVYTGDGDWTRQFSGLAGSEGKVYSFGSAESADLKPDLVVVY